MTRAWWRRAAVLGAGVAGLLATGPATAGAGGVEWMYPVRDRYEPGQDVLMVGYTLTAEPGDRGPYYAWLRVDPAGEARGVVVGSADADPPDVRVAPVVIEATVDDPAYGRRASISFTLPDDLPAGHYSLVLCDDPCTRAPGLLAPEVLSVGVPPASAPTTSPAVLLAWTPQRLDPALSTAATIDPQVSATSVVRGGPLDLVESRTAGGTVVDAPTPGWAIPLDAIAVDPTSHARFASGNDRGALAGLGPGEALLSATSAGLRRLHAGDTVELAGGVTLTVAAVVTDTSIGGAELAVDARTGLRVGLTTDRFLLAAYAGDRTALEERLRAALAEGGTVRFRGPGETPFLRNGDAVLPQAQLKQRFGEFAHRPGAGDDIDQDPRWQAENLVEVDLPIVGRTRCHREVVDALAGALGALVDANLADLVAPDGFAGCWNARTTRRGDAISRHAWGVAIDLNFGTNPTGLASIQDPRLVATFARWGFTDGASWLIPDAGHFEYVGPPRP